MNENELDAQALDNEQEVTLGNFHIEEPPFVCPVDPAEANLCDSCQ